MIYGVTVICFFRLIRELKRADDRTTRNVFNKLRVQIHNHRLCRSIRHDDGTCKGSVYMASLLLTKNEIRSIGRGNTIVEFFSVDIVFSV